MKGLAIWAQIKCRSVMELYRQMARTLDVPLIVPIWHEKPLGADIRKDVGFKGDEFADIPSVTIGDDFKKGVRFIDEHRDWRHIFCVYQSAPVFCRLIAETKRRTGKVGVMSEAPCNMSNGLRGALKECYLRFLLWVRVKDAARNADYFVNYSGNDDKYLKSIGWDREKVIPFGYFPPRCVNLLQHLVFFFDLHSNSSFKKSSGVTIAGQEYPASFTTFTVLGKTKRFAMCLQFQVKSTSIP